ncbi:MAG: DEAD/DEAH box helicase family protein [Verrucomicrobiota bacterium]|jgi:type III restriction enzyme
MSPHVNAIAGRLSLRPPQRESLEILDRITEVVPPSKTPDVAAALAVIQSEFPKVTDFEREFPSICFALATGVGKTRLMGAFIAYLHLAKGINNFFVLAPNLTIYNKLITDFTPNTPKYVFKGIAEFATDAPELITGDTYDKRSLFGDIYRVRINIFNISKINSEVRGGNMPRIRKLSEYIGQSYFDYLAGLPDLVLLMDESHRYRASAGVRAINELKPLMGLELTATPFVEAAKGAAPFKNVVYDYPLARAMADGFVKEPAVVTQKNFDPRQFTPAQLQELKLQDGIRLHEATKVELETYARQNECRQVKPFVLVIARDTTHAKELLDLIQSEKFFEGRYKERVIQVDSSQTGAQEEAMIERLLKVEDPSEPTEIVIHVNMLKEGWDVNNLYTIVPLRAANARILIEQSIGRGLRLPYGVRTGVTAVDRLNIVAHDRFQEIVDEANKPDSPVRLTQVILDPATDLQPTRTVIAQPTLLAKLTPPAPTPPGVTPGKAAQPMFATEQERKIAEIAVKVIQQHESLPQVSYLQQADVQADILHDVAAAYVAPAQTELAGVVEKPDIAAVVAKATRLVIDQTINIPRIVVVPTGDVTSGFNSFKVDCSSIHLQPVSRDLLIQHLRTAKQEFLQNLAGQMKEARPEDYLVRALIDFDDICYDDHADLLYDLTGQVVQHLRSYLSEADAVNVLQYHQQQLAPLIHSQMQSPEHRWEKATGYKATVSKGFSLLKPNAYTAGATDEIKPFRMTLPDPTNIRRYLFGGFAKCLYDSQRFDVDTERRFAMILEDDGEVMKWFKPARGQFQIYYNKDAAYEPDFVVETKKQLFLCEPKRADQLQNPEVLAKKAAASEWCKYATEHAMQHGGKQWSYLLIPHDAITGNMTLEGLASRFEVQRK